MAPTLFKTLLFLVCLYALLRGTQEARVVAVICLFGSLATSLLISPLNERYSGVETGVFIVDVAVLTGFVAVALRSSRFWPLWIAGLQLTTTFGHAMKGVTQDLLPQAYAAALSFWAYPIILILAVGVWRGHRREVLGRGRSGREMVESGGQPV